MINSINDVKDKNITVIGFGVSHRPLVKLLVEKGSKVTVRDKKSVEELGEDASALLGKVEFITGEDYLKNITGDIVFKTPGMRNDKPEFIEAVKKGCELISEMELFFRLCPCKIFAVTGSEGKTTSTTLIYNFLTAIWAEISESLCSPKLKALNLMISPWLSFHLSSLTI